MESLPYPLVWLAYLPVYAVFIDYESFWLPEQQHVSIISLSVQAPYTWTVSICFVS